MEITRIAIIDVSGSMRDPFSNELASDIITRRTNYINKFDAALDHLRFAIQKVPSSSELIIIAFAESAEVVYQGGVDDTRAIESSISRLTPNGRRTNLASAFELVLALISSGRHRIRPLDVVTDGLSNIGDPVQPARELQKRYGVYIHLYLIDPTAEGLSIAYKVVGREGEGEVDPVASASALMGLQRTRLAQEEEEIEHIYGVRARHAEERQQFALEMTYRERPKFTAAYPEVIVPGQWRTLDLFVYLNKFAEIVHREIQKLRYRENIDYGDTSSQFPVSLPKGCPIRVSLRSDTILANPSELTILWFEPYNRVSFRIATIDGMVDEMAASLDIDIFADELPVASMRLPITVSSDIKKKVRAISDAQWYENIFASYAREDLIIVKHLKERYAALGLYMFIDLDDLRSGARWRPALFEEIERSDLFQLFWSNFAKASEYVMVEWKHALEVSEAKGGRFVRPFYWEDPIPDVPEELSDINFRRISFVNQLDQ